ncbi:MAG: addiction module protein [Thermoanaerobaculales bacterium]|nr:addiction module protein [Thermoanaerobaculales bacterium]
MDSLEDLTKELLGLPLDQRATLAEKLLASLETLNPEEQELEQIWAAEAERRFRGYQDGKIEAIDGPLVHRQVLTEIE